MLLNSSRRLCVSSLRSSTYLRPTGPPLQRYSPLPIKIEAVPSTSFVSSELSAANEHGACPLCQLNTTVNYADVLVLRQFMRKDGTVLPREMTGLCYKQQLTVEQAVMQAHWSGLFPSHKLPPAADDEGPVRDYTMFKRHWATPRSMYERRMEMRMGTWKYARMFERFDTPFHPHQAHLAEHAPPKKQESLKDEAAE